MAAAIGSIQWLGRITGLAEAGVLAAPNARALSIRVILAAAPDLTGDHEGICEGRPSQSVDKEPAYIAE
mgnify:CR=1 FL=1